MLTTIQRKILIWVVSFVTTALSCVAWPTLPHPIIFLILIILAILVQRFYYAPILVGAITGILWMASVGHWQVHWQLPIDEITKVHVVTGKVTAIKNTNNHPVFTLKVNEVNGKPVWFAPNIRLSWRKPSHSLKQGYQASFHVKLKPVHGLANLGGFRYQQWLVSHQIVATGYVKSIQPNSLLTNASIRQQLIDKVLQFPLEHRAWLLALTFGERGYLSAAQWELIQNTGIAHLIAISGLHLGIVTVFSLWLYSCVLKSLSGLFRLRQNHQYQWLGSATVLTIGYFYAVLAGLSLPTLRAILMLALLFLLKLTMRKISVAQFLLLSLFLFIVLWPLSMLSLSFWLSFGAMATIGFVIWRWPQHRQNMLEPASIGKQFYRTTLFAIRFQLILGILMMPMVAVSFSFISLHAFFINLVAVPLVTLLIVPLCLLAAAFLLVNSQVSLVIFHLIDRILSWCLAGLGYFDQDLFTVFQLPSIPILSWLFVALFLYMLLSPMGNRIKMSSLLLLIPILTFGLPNKQSKWFIHVLDVGQGLSVVIQKNEHAIVYDVGPSFSSGFNMADAVLLPFLQASNISQVDWVIVSHFDNDHAGSLAPLLQTVSVAHFASNQDRCKKGWSLRWQGLSIASLWPNESKQTNANDSSCVVMVSDGINRVLLTGDISKRVEYELINPMNESVHADVLIAAHHGSNTSSSSAFIEAVGPRFVVFSQGYMNRWKFPSQQVVDRYVAKKVALYATSDSGQVSFEFDPNTQIIKPYSHRENILRTWYNRAIW